MYRVWDLSEKEKEKVDNGELFLINHWDGDIIVHTICESKEEYKQEKERVKRIEEAHRKAISEAIKMGIY